MRVGIHTWGSEGDMRPFFALADGLVTAGHEVRLAYCAVDGRDYSARLSGAGFVHRAIGVLRSREDLTRVSGEIFAERNPLRQLGRIVHELLDPVLDDFADSALETAEWADVLVAHMFAHPLAAASELTKKPFVSVFLAPMMPTRAIPVPGMPDLGFMNRAAWAFTLSVLSNKLGPSFGRVRVRIGVPFERDKKERFGRSVIDLVGVSPTLFPRPVDWPAKVHVPGFFSPSGAQKANALDPELEAFMAEGAPPVYVGFGSMSAVESDPRGVHEIIERAIQKVGGRAIIQSEISAPKTQNILHITAAPHDQIFPRCSAIVHHGGAGTTQTAMRAGRPSVIVAHIADQAMWAKQLQKLGVAPPHLYRWKLETHRLARAIELATKSEPMRARAESVGTAMRQEDGVSKAVALIETAAQS